jgi:hypothetical protein
MTDITPERSSLKAFHLAGIIPVAGQPLEFNMPWDDCLMPIAPSYLAIERAVYECACAGCETIWIVLHKEAQPLIRHRLGDWIEDPLYTHGAKKNFDPKNAALYKKRVPIYYVPIHPKDRDKRDCLSWSVLYGAMRAYHVSKLISKWVVPDKYYVSFPYGVFSCNEVRTKFRELISSKESFYLSWNGKTVADGEYLSFTFGGEEFVEYRRKIRQGTGLKKPGQVFDFANMEKLPHEERWSARHFTLDKVFGDARIQDGNIGTLDWYYPIATWDDYCFYLSSKEREWVRRPNSILKYHEFNPIGEDEDGEE